MNQQQLYLLEVQSCPLIIITHNLKQKLNCSRRIILFIVCAFTVYYWHSYCNPYSRVQSNFRLKSKIESSWCLYWVGDWERQLDHDKVDIVFACCIENVSLFKFPTHINLFLIKLHKNSRGIAISNSQITVLMALHRLNVPIIVNLKPSHSHSHRIAHLPL